MEKKVYRAIVVVVDVFFLSAAQFYSNLKRLYVCGFYKTRASVTNWQNGTYYGLWKRNIDVKFLQFKR